MKKSEIRIIQKNLADTDLYAGEIDGKRGAKTNTAIEAALVVLAAQLAEDWKTWSSKRKAVAYLQSICLANNIEAGKIDGLYGPQTESASEQLKLLFITGAIPRGFGDIIPVRTNPHNFPIETEASLNAYYGNPCEINLVRVQCPWQLRLDWELRTTTNTISIHEKLADSLADILHKAYAIYGVEGISQLGLDRYGGSMNCRKKRGSRSAWSTHAWGIAIDWFPSKNKLSWNSRRASLAHPDLDPWWELWEQEGWLSLGRREDRDWMHVQAAKR